VVREKTRLGTTGFLVSLISFSHNLNPAALLLLLISIQHIPYRISLSSQSVYEHTIMSDYDDYDDFSPSTSGGGGGGAKKVQTRQEQRGGSGGSGISIYSAKHIRQKEALQQQQKQKQKQTGKSNTSRQK
jgi:hypothetical protein